MVDLRKFFQATNPSRTLSVENPEDRKYYIDFSPVRGKNIVEKLRDDIVIFSPDQPTCSLFTGHIGCGKSTELLRLKDELQQHGFHVVYFESDQDLEMGDVDVSDILLTIAHRVSQSLDDTNINSRTGWCQTLLKELKEFLETTQVTAVACPIIGEIALQARSSPRLRQRLRGYLEPRTNEIIRSINEELLEPATEKLQYLGKQGLVVIIDNLDRVDFSPRPTGRSQPEYLFIDRATQLRSLHCHVIYTIPLALLRFSNDFNVVSKRFMTDPQVLPMVPVQLRDGQEHKVGMQLLRDMVLARAFPNLDKEQRFNQLAEVFDGPETLDRLCQASGGHVRNLLRLLNNWIKRERQLPLSRDRLEEIIQDERNQMILGIVQPDWKLLRQVAQRKQISIEDDDQKARYQKLLRNLLVLEYLDREGPWFGVDPILAEARELQL